MSDKIKTTGIGSLPEMSIEKAFEYCLRFDIPFFPQIASLHEDMISQVQKCNFLHLDSFITLMESKKRDTFKIQIAGPTTTRLDKSYYDKIVEKFNNIKFKGKIILCIDEPIIMPSSIRLINDYKLLNSNFIPALHSCADNLKNIITPTDSLKFKYLFFDYFLNTDIDKKLNAELLAPGCVNHKNQVKRPQLRYSELISSSCGLQNCTDIEANLKLLNRLKNY